MVIAKMRAKDLFNATQVFFINQDYRHLIIIDIRNVQLYNASKLISSFHISQCNQKLFQNIQNIYIQRQATYKTKKVRRVVIVSDQILDANNEKIKFFQKQIQMHKDYNFYYLDCLYDKFIDKYSFLQINKKELDLMQNEQPQFQKSKQLKLSKKDEYLLICRSKFPCQIIQQQIYLGTLHNSNNKKQLQFLHIKSLIDFINHAQQQVISNIKQNYDYLNIPLNQNLNVQFNQINMIISNQKKPILLYCEQGNKSICIAISYVMFKKKISLQLASMYVFKAFGQVNPQKWLYQQLMIYQPTNK